MTAAITPRLVRYDQSEILIGDDPTVLWVPDHVADGTDVTLFVLVHGWGSAASQGQFIYGVPGTKVGEMAIDRGWVVMSPHLSGSSWGNDESMQDWANLYAHANARWNVTRVVLEGISAGGLACASAVGRGVVPDVVALITVDAVLHPQNWYNSLTSRKDSVDLAWGTTDITGYQAALDARPGSDLTNDDPTLWSAPRLFIAASPNDTVVRDFLFSDLFVAHVDPVADVTYTKTSGAHVVEANWLIPESVAWLDGFVPPYSGASGGGGTTTPPPASSSSNLRATDGSPVALRSTAGDVVSLSPA